MTLIRPDDEPLIPDDQIEVSASRSLEILQEIISSTLVVGFRTRLVFRSKEDAQKLFQGDKYLNLDTGTYAGSTEIAFDGGMLTNAVEAVSLDEDQMMSARTLVFTQRRVH